MTAASTDRLRILVVSSVGGHLDEVMQAADVLRDHEVVLVVNDEVRLPDFPFERVYRIEHAERDLRVITNFLEAASILAREEPDVIFSTGAGPVVPFAVLARLFTSTKIVYIETAAAVTAPTLTGRLMYPLAHAFFYQWPGLQRHFPRGTYANIVFP